MLESRNLPTRIICLKKSGIEFFLESKYESLGIKVTLANNQTFISVALCIKGTTRIPSACSCSCLVA
jgi:hypothetical protein